MPKDKLEKKGTILRHSPLATDMEKPIGKLRAPKPGKTTKDSEFDRDHEDDALPAVLGEKIYSQALSQRKELTGAKTGATMAVTSTSADDSDEYDDDIEEEDVEYAEDLVEFDGEHVSGAGLSEAEEAVIQRFLHAGHQETRTLADIIMEKIREKEDSAEPVDEESTAKQVLPPKVIEVYTSVGTLLKHYKSGKLPKALKMLPHLKNWEEVLWLTRPDEWSPCATYACTRIFASNLNAKMAQRFYNLVLLEKCRDDIRTNKTLNYHLYMALKKALFKPAAFYKGVLLPIAQSRTCTLREATIIGSVLSKVSIPGNHSAAALLRMTEMPYSGSNSLFIRVLVNKKYSLPRRVIDALVDHFLSFSSERREIPVVWHQALLAFAQRYKLELTDEQRHHMKNLIKIHVHHQISPEIKRELLVRGAKAGGGTAIAADDDDDTMGGV